MTDTAQPLPANDRLKRRFGDIFAYALIAATGMHFLVLQMWPPITVADWSSPPEEAVLVMPLDDIPLPAPPVPISRPALPIAVDDVPATATIESVPWDQVKEPPPPPPPDTRASTGAREGFFPFDVAPRLANAAEFQLALLRAYPAALRDAGIGGTVVLVAHISEEGMVLEARIGEGSGHARLDEAALGLVDVMRFTPALNRDRKVAVWVSLPVDFRIRRDDR